MNILLKRNLSKILLFTFILFACITFVACGEGKSNNEKPDTYKITVQQNTDVEVTLDKNSAKSGEIVTFTIILNSVDAYIESVTVYNRELSSSNNSYSFIMKNEDATIVVTTSKYQEILSDNFIEFNSISPNQIIVQDSYPGDGWGAYLTYDFTEEFVENTSDTVRVLESTNQDVIPNEALEHSYITLDGSYKSGGNIYIDSSMIKVGTTYIILEIKNTYNSSAGSSRVIKKIEVVNEEDFEYSDLYYTVSLTLDVRSVKTDSPYFSIELSDRDSARYYGFDYSKLTYTIDGIEKVAEVTGSTCRFKFALEDLTTNELTITFSYFIGHKYSISFLGFQDDGYNIGPEYEWTTYAIQNKINNQAEYTSTGGLRFNYNGASLELTISK